MYLGITTQTPIEGRCRMDAKVRKCANVNVDALKCLSSACCLKSPIPTRLQHGPFNVVLHKTLASLSIRWQQISGHFDVVIFYV
jgi:hypothetical protein